MERQSIFVKRHQAVVRINLSIARFGTLKLKPERYPSVITAAGATVAHLTAIGDTDFFERQSSHSANAKMKKKEGDRISKLGSKELIKEIEHSLAVL